MAITFSTKASFTNSFRDLFKSQKYEEYVYMIISKSEIVFNGKKFTHIHSQANGESDFSDQEGGKYDVKLIFDEKQGRLLGEHKNDIIKWFETLYEEMTEFSEKVIRYRNTELIKDTKLYSILIERLCSVEENENAIFFIPYPIVHDIRDSIILQLTTDFLQAVCNKIEEEKLLGDRKIYFIYPSMEQSIYVLRDGNQNKEYVECKELDAFIIYETNVK